jgi:hypothetical protein
MRENMKKWQIFVEAAGVLSLLVTLLGLVRDLFDIRLEWSAKAGITGGIIVLLLAIFVSALIRYSAFRNKLGQWARDPLVRFVVFSVLIVAVLLFMYSRIQQLESRAREKNAEVASAYATQEIQATRMATLESSLTTREVEATSAQATNVAQTTSMAAADSTRSAQARAIVVVQATRVAEAIGLAMLQTTRVAQATELAVAHSTTTRLVSEISTLQARLTLTVTPQVVVKSETANVRSGPGRCHSIVASASQGQIFDIVGKNADDGWWQICCPNRMSGWIYASLVEVSGPTADVPTVTAPPCPSPPPPTPISYYHKYRMNCSPVPHQGKRSLCCETASQADPDGHGGTVGIYLVSGDPIDLSSATTMSVWVYDTQGNNTLELRLIDRNGCASNTVWSAMEAVQNKWTGISWSLLQFTNLDPDPQFSAEGCNTFDKRQVKSIELFEWNDGMYCFADITWH